MGNDPAGDGKEMGAVVPSPLVETEWPQPDWQSEKGQPTRALWRIAVMAGNLKPDKAIRDQRKKADESWREEYLTLANAMKDALSPNPQDTDLIYFNPEHSGNADRVKQKSRWFETRVDMLSALLFIERRLGPEKMPAGMLEMLRFKQSNSPQPSGVSVGKKKRSDSSAPEPAKKDPEPGIETKASNRLKAFLFATLLRGLHKSSHQGRDQLTQKRVIEELESIAKEFGLNEGEGFGAYAFHSLTKDLGETYYHFLDSRKKVKDRTHHEPNMGSPSVR